MLPVRHTLFDAQGLAAQVAGAFDIGAVTDCRLWRIFINDVYQLEAAGRRWWLRLHPAGWRTRAETQSEIAAILAISEAGGAVARPVPRRGGGHLLEIEAPEGMRGAVLFEDAPGADLDFSGSDAAANARRYGAAVARLHDACDGVHALPGRPGMDLAFAVLDPAISLARHVGPEDRADLARIARRLADVLRSCGDLSMGFCHGDLNTTNIHFLGEASVAFDFDCCAWGWRAFELAAFARGVTWRSRPGDAADALVRAYHEGYRSRRPIAEGDLAVQPAMLLAQRMWVTALHLDGADRWGAIHFGRSYADRFMAWLRGWEPALDCPPAWR